MESTSNQHQPLCGFITMNDCVCVAAGGMGGSVMALAEFHKS